MACQHGRALALVLLGATVTASFRGVALPTRQCSVARSRILSVQRQEERQEQWNLPRLGGDDGPPDFFWPLGGREESSSSPDVDERVGESAVAFGALASSALISEAIQVVGTGALIYFAKEFTQASDLTGAVSALADYFQQLGPSGYALYAGIMVFLQVVPVASAFVLLVSSGVIFGSTAKATALMSAASAASAALAFLIARFVLRDKILDIASDNKTVIQLDKALSKADFGTSMLVIILLRSSPLLPYSWASYLFGISRVPFSAYILGSWLGTLPAIFAYVEAGQLSSEIVLSGSPPSWLVKFGLAATVGAVTVIGNLASRTLKELDVDLED